MLPILALAVFLSQPPTEAAASVAFRQALGRSILAHTLKGQLTILTRARDETTLLVYDYTTTVGKTPMEFRTEGTLHVGLEPKPRYFIATADGKSLTLYDQKKNCYSVRPLKDGLSQSIPYAGLIPLFGLVIAQKESKLAIPKIQDRQVAEEVLEALPTLLAQKGLPNSVHFGQEADGRFSLQIPLGDEKGESQFTLTLNAENAALARFRAEISLADGTRVTTTDVLERCTPVTKMPIFSFAPTRRAKKVGSLAPWNEP